MDKVVVDVGRGTVKVVASTADDDAVVQAIRPAWAADMARRQQVDIDRASISTWANDPVAPDRSVRQAIARVLGVT